MIPESKLIKKEVVLRELLLSKEVLETKNSLIRWIALSLGLINQNESRLSMLSVFEALVYFQFVEKKDVSFEEIMNYLQTHQQTLNEKSVRYHLLQLKRKGIIENKKGLWYFSGSNKYDVNSWIDEYLNSFSNIIAPNIKTAFSNLLTKLK
jgi:hypothetical protein